MSFSPFLTPDRSRRRSALAARRRRRRRVLAAVLVLAVVATAIVFGAMALASRSGHPRRGGARATIRATTIRTAPRRRSPYGFPLARPALALSGIATPARNPVQISFRDPPREGLLFNLSTGQVLWQHNPTERVPIASLTKMMTALLTVRAAPPDAPVLVTREAVDADGSKVGVLPLGRLVDALTSAPARVVGLEAPRIREGARADLILVDPRARWTIDPARLMTRSRNTPFAGTVVEGRVTMTVCEGRVVHE